MSVVEVTVAEHCAVIEVDDFSPLSRYDAPFARDLGRAVVEACDDDAVKVVLLRARNADFAPEALPAPIAVREVLTTWHRDFAGSDALYQALCFAKKVVVTEVTGDVIGAGAMLVLCSDLTVAADTARIGSPFSSHPEANFALAALTMRLNRAKAWMLRESVLTAAQALEQGLVNRVVPAADLTDAVSELTRSVTGMPLDGVTMSKMLLQSVLDAHGVGRDFDLADQYAIHLWSETGVAR
ncbi:hypothetical protein GCM10017691_37650 [Pseudonocardia petroleophila]|uniref:Enoyl-CoA hydratase/isomerase family protein n=1 Tax=Pseudonocardia petroleophila TaxID=37331 RepID=A0A7G7MCH8_9PSEU|nr:enoyl-CoA hydratase/isomerase family protein [Pseudonocardia petroleophila]QNG50489.1 enoyl-CoA hydratase/isomerase family protein [Pseudonocardia petroleophila]